MLRRCRVAAARRRGHAAHGAARAARARLSRAGLGSGSGLRGCGGGCRGRRLRQASLRLALARSSRVGRGARSSLRLRARRLVAERLRSKPRWDCKNRGNVLSATP